MRNLYKELAYDMSANTELTMAQALQAVQFIYEEGLLDYDALKEYYEDE